MDMADEAVRLHELLAGVLTIGCVRQNYARSVGFIEKSSCDGLHRQRLSRAPLVNEARDTIDRAVVLTADDLPNCVDTGSSGLALCLFGGDKPDSSRCGSGHERGRCRSHSCIQRQDRDISAFCAILGRLGVDALDSLARRGPSGAVWQASLSSPRGISPSLIAFFGFRIELLESRDDCRVDDLSAHGEKSRLGQRRVKAFKQKPQ